MYAAVNFNMTYHKGMNFYTQKFIYVCSINFVQDVLKRKEKKTRIKDLMSEVKVQWSRYRPGVAQRVGRGIALLFHDRGTRRGWVVSSTPRPQFKPGIDPVPILQEAGWATGPVWTCGKSRPHRDSILDRPAQIQSLYLLSYLAHNHIIIIIIITYTESSKMT